MHATCTTALVSVILGTIATAGAAQARGFSLEGAGLYADVSGDDFSGTNAGVGFDAQARFSWGAFSLGAGVQYSSHGLDGLSENLGVRGFFAEPRYAFPTAAGNLTPYLVGRLALLHERIEVGSSKAEANGTAFGGGGGLAIRLASTVDLSVSVLYAAVSFGDVELNGTEQPNTDTSGSTLALRAGIAVKFGR